MSDRLDGIRVDWSVNSWRAELRSMIAEMLAADACQRDGVAAQVAADRADAQQSAATAVHAAMEAAVSAHVAHQSLRHQRARQKRMPYDFLSVGIEFLARGMVIGVVGLAWERAFPRISKVDRS